MKKRSLLHKKHTKRACYEKAKMPIPCVKGAQND